MIFGGDLLGFGSIPSAPSQTIDNTGFGADLMGFGISAPQSAPQLPSQPVSQPLNLGFNFGINSTPTVSQPPQTSPQNNFGINLLGNNNQPISQKISTPSLNQGFKQIINTNPNKILAY